MLKILTNITKSKKQVLLLYSCTIIGVFIGVLVSILNTRSLCPSEYGDVRYINNIIALISGLFLFGYFVSGCRLLAVSKTREESREIKGIMLVILFGTVLLMMLVMAGLGVFYNVVLEKPYANLFFVAIPFCGSTILLNYQRHFSQKNIKKIETFFSIGEMIIGQSLYKHAL